LDAVDAADAVATATIAAAIGRWRSRIRRPAIPIAT
jgi:hypothetical protein